MPRLIEALALGAAGGALFARFDLPLAWMIGAMVFTTVAALAGRPLAVPGPLRSVMIVVIGVLIGSSFTPEVLHDARRWPLTMLGLVGYLCVATSALYLYFTRVLGFPRLTAYFCATPGGLTEMVLQAGAMGADDRTVALVQGSRVLLVVLVIPFWFRWTEGITTTVSGTAPSFASVGAADLAILAGCAIAGVLVGRAIRLPAYVLTGPMIASGIVHAAGLSDTAPPWQLVALAQVVIGAALGSRFTGLSLGRVLRGIAAAVGSTTLLLILTVGFALVISPLSGIARAPIILAYSPGGLPEMSLIALALGLEPAFVVTHHVFRVALIVAGAPLLMRIAKRRDAGNGERDPDP